MGNYPGWEKYLPPAARLPRRSKYRAEPTDVDGHRFASQREAARYGELKLQLQAGAITGLELQPTYPLTVIGPDGIAVEIGRYLADFRYQRQGRTVVEDAKGMRTPIYSWKKRHVEAQYGIAIVEV